MIDHFALLLGHGLLAFAMFHLLVRKGLDADPLIESIREETAARRAATTAAGRHAARRNQTGTPDNPSGDRPEA